MLGERAHPRQVGGELDRGDDLAQFTGDRGPQRQQRHRDGFEFLAHVRQVRGQVHDRFGAFDVGVDQRVGRRRDRGAAWRHIACNSPANWPRLSGNAVLIIPAFSPTSGDRPDKGGRGGPTRRDLAGLVGFPRPFRSVTAPYPRDLL